MSEMQTKIPPEAWFDITWDEYINTVDNPAYDKAKCYYDNGKARIEMSPVGNDHASDHTIIIFAVNLFATLKGIPINGKDNCSYRKPGSQEAQPDISYYIGDNADAVPWGTSIINLDIYPPPNLAIEVANRSLADDKGEKRLLYENLNVEEYWIVDVRNVRVFAFAVADRGSRTIDESIALPGLAISILNEALQRTRQMNQSQVGNWLLTQFQKQIKLAE